MSSSIQLQFNLNQDAVLEDIEVAIDRNPNFDCIVIQNVQKSGLELILNNWFKPVIFELPNVFGIILKINTAISETFNDGPRSLDFRSKPSFLVAFESTVGNHETIIFWKAPGDEEFYSICVDGDVNDMLCDFLIQEIKYGSSGIIRLPNNRKKIRLHEIGDNQERDLLTIAVNKGQSEVVQSLLKHDFVADNVINLAWNRYLTSNDIQKPTRNEIILILLNANSNLPDNFEYDEASPEIHGFLNWCEDLKKYVDNENLESLRLKLVSRPNLIYFYDRNNQSLLAYAIRTNKTKVFKTFASRLITGSHENINDIYKQIQKTDKRMMRKKREQNPFNFPQAHLLVLKSKTRISSNDQNAEKHWEYIEEAYQTINSIEYCSKILQVAAECKSVQIFFDFKHGSTYYMDPATSVYSWGITYESGIIYIGANGLLNETTKHKVFGVIVHELCHLAVYIGFVNQNFDPFPIGESELKTRFKYFLMVQCKQNEDSERIIGNVFGYPKEMQESEMIVTYPQILMQHFGNAAKIEELERIFDELVKYSKEVVEPELDRALKVLKLLNDDTCLIKFNHLTEPMKARILHCTIYLQGAETTLFEIVGSDQEILNALTSENIRKVLLKNQSIEIGDAVKLEMEYGIIPRNFEKIIEEIGGEESENEAGRTRKKRKINKPKTETRTFEQARSEAKNSKVFLLADHAGSGKTTIFKDCTKKFKKLYKNCWVSFINLRKHGKIFEQYKNKIDSLTLVDVRQILLQIVNPKLGLETTLFNKLFESGQAVFLFDGVDEISPIYTELLMKIFTILCQMEPRNQMWISTRPHYAQRLSESLNTPYHKFTQYNTSEINKFIMEILKFHGIENEEEQERNLDEINKCMKGLKGYYYQSKEIENPLMVQMVSELYIEKKVDPNNISRYGVYEAMQEKQKENVGEKIPNLERDKDFNLNIWDVHRLLALISLVGDDYKKELKFKLEDLEIMKKWKKEKQKWTPDMIQRYGFVIVDLSSENVERSSIDFMHRTYAEFFVAQILSKVISNDNNDIYKDPKILDIFSALMKRKKKFHVVEDFVLSLLKDKISKNEKIDVTKVRTIYAEEIRKFYQMEFGGDFYSELQNWIRKYGRIASSIDIKALEELWKLDKGKNLLQEYFKAKDMVYDEKIIQCAEICFGSSWCEKFNKGEKKLITDDEIVKFQNECKTYSQWNYLKNLLKFCDLLDKNFTMEEKKKFYLKNDSKFELKLRIDARNEIISRARNSLDRNEFCKTFFLNANLEYVRYENLKHILNIIDNDFINDKDSLKELLFQSTERLHSPFFKYLGDSEQEEIFVLIKDFYIRHKNSWKEIQDIILDDDIMILMQHISFCYKEYKAFIIKAFGTDFSRLAIKIEDFVRNKEKVFVWRKDFLEDLLNLIFSNDTEKVTNIISNIANN